MSPSLWWPNRSISLSRSALRWRFAQRGPRARRGRAGDAWRGLPRPQARWNTRSHEPKPLVSARGARGPNWTPYPQHSHSIAPVLAEAPRAANDTGPQLLARRTRENGGTSRATRRTHNLPATDFSAVSRAPHGIPQGLPSSRAEIRTNTGIAPFRWAVHFCSGASPTSVTRLVDASSIHYLGHRAIYRRLDQAFGRSLARGN